MYLHIDGSTSPQPQGVSGLTWFSPSLSFQIFFSKAIDITASISIIDIMNITVLSTVLIAI